MEHKKSINAKDIFLYEQNNQQKIIGSNDYHWRIAQSNQPHFINIQYHPAYHQKQKEKTSAQHSFLFNIRASRGKNRYKMKQDFEQLQSPANSVELVRNLQNNQLNMIKSGIQPTLNRKRIDENYSPFDNQKIQSLRGQIVQHSTSAFQNPQIKKKIKIKIKRQKTQSPSRYQKSKSVKDGTKQSRLSAKFVEFKTVFSKTRIFQNRKSHVLEMSDKKLNPYQLSIRRKNIKLMKVKLNSLGQKADEIERQKFDQISKMCQANKLNMIRQLKRHRATRQVKQKDIFQTIEPVITEHNRNFTILSKTIEIRQVPNTARKRSKQRNKPHESHSGRQYQKSRIKTRIKFED